VKRFGIKGKLAPRYTGPFLVLARLGNMAYRLELPPALAGVHNVFHVSQLKKCLMPQVHVVVDDVSPLDADRSYPEHQVKILDRQDRVTRYRMIQFFKVRWSHHSKQEATWETEEFLRSKYPWFLPRSDAHVTSFVSLHCSKSRGEISLRGEGCNIPPSNPRNHVLVMM
jgi:hypothetical protein